MKPYNQRKHQYSNKTVIDKDGNKIETAWYEDFNWSG